MTNRIRFLPQVSAVPSETSAKPMIPFVPFPLHSMMSMGLPAIWAEIYRIAEERTQEQVQRRDVRPIPEFSWN